MFQMLWGWSPNVHAKLVDDISEEMTNVVKVTLIDKRYFIVKIN
jgi:hypothetical protein